MHGLEQGSAALKQLQSEYSLERVEKLMDTTHEGVAYQREIDETLMSKMSSEEEEAVLKELEALEREQMVSRRRWPGFHGYMLILACHPECTRYDSCASAERSSG